MAPIDPQLTPLIRDMAWCWWTRPRAVCIGDTAYFGALNSAGHMLAATLDLKTGASEKFLLAGFEDDDHNNPALVVTPDKPLVAVYSRHDAPEGLRWRVSDRPLDISSWSDERILPFDGPTTYAQIHVVDGILHLFTRVDETRWGWRRSTDWAASWEAPRELLDFDTDQLIYMPTVLMPDGRTLRVGVSGHPKEYDKRPLHDVWACLVDLVTGEVTLPSSGKSVGNLFTGAGLPLDYSALELVSKTPTDRTTNIFDVSDGPEFEIGFVSKIKDDNSTRDAHYHVSTLRAGQWTTETIAPAGTKFGYIHAGFYAGGVAFPNRSPGGRIYLTRESDGLWTLERYDRGTDHRWHPHTLIPPTPTRLTRPWALTNPAPSLEVVTLALEKYDDDSYYGSLSHLVGAGIGT